MKMTTVDMIADVNRRLRRVEEWIEQYKRDELKAFEDR